MTRIVDFYTALARYENKSALDPDIMASVKEIKVDIFLLLDTYIDGCTHIRRIDLMSCLSQ